MCCHKWDLMVSVARVLGKFNLQKGYNFMRQFLEQRVRGIVDLVS
ncbi:hypothetical protein OIU77_000909 [Salix suchowensis]|uniref:Uncharacterized protein n=1 Tax=Salix suchowensis TaxID=1278906 RepID=A0ABQ9BA63_9ROSI|nr:hypothetical protein OIU77_000909 [Salix suchowensis]